MSTIGDDREPSSSESSNRTPYHEGQPLMMMKRSKLPAMKRSQIVGMSVFTKRPFCSSDDVARPNDHLFQTADGLPLLDSVCSSFGPNGTPAPPGGETLDLIAFCAPAIRTKQTFVVRDCRGSATARGHPIPGYTARAINSLWLVTVTQPSGPGEGQARHLLPWNRTGHIPVHSAAKVFGVRTQVLPSLEVASEIW